MEKRMEELQIFSNAEFGEVRTLVLNNEPWFVGKDVARILKYERPTKAIADHVDVEDRDEVPIQDSIGRMQNTPIINESGLYSLILSSKLPSAKKFKRWVTSEVLPSICKHGAYMTESVTEKALTDPDFLIKLATELKQERAEKQRLVEENAKMVPAKIFADAVKTSGTSVLIGDLAKILHQNGVDIGQKRLFSYLRENGYLIKGGSSKNMPTQRAMQLSLFEIKESCYVDSKGVNVVTRTTKVTGKGQIYFVNKFLTRDQVKQTIMARFKSRDKGELV
jgi:prophage antirepressor